MEKKIVSRKVPIVLAIVWLVCSMGIVMFTVPQMIRMEGVFADWNAQMLVFFAEGVFCIGMMIAIRILSVKAQIKWLAILSKILLIFYSVVGGLGLVGFLIVSLINV